jgi:hypothetical protein
MLNRLLSFVVCLCLLANVNLGCATVTGAHAPSPISMGIQVHDALAMAGCDDHALTKGHSKAPASHQSSACKTFCGSILVQPTFILHRTHFLQHIEIALQSATPSWDSSIDPPRPRLLARMKTPTQIQI